MNFDFSDELLQLRDQARRFLTDRCPPAVPRRILDTDEPYAADLWRAIAEMGWTGAAIPEEYGGVGLGRLAVCVLAEELGRAVAPVPFSSSVYLATEALLLFGSEQQKQNWLPKLATGEIIGTFAHGRTPRHIRSRQTDRLGHRRPPDRERNSPSRTATSPTLLSSRPTHRSSSGGPARPWGHPRNRCHLRSHALARPNRVRQRAQRNRCPGSDIRRLLDYAAVPMAFEQVGDAQAALDMANAYAKERFAFGRPIGSFQGIKHKLADMYIQVELARSNAYYGAWAVHTDAAELPSPPRSPASPPARPAGSLPRKTSRPMAAWASPGRWTVIYITGAPNC